MEFELKYNKIAFHIMECYAGTTWTRPRKEVK